MPTPPQRDLATTRRVLESWLARHLADAEQVRVGPVRLPPTGNSNETLLFDAAWIEHGRRVERHLVARIQPDAHHLFLGAAVLGQYRTMAALAARTTLPVPGMVAAEPDPGYLGGAFFLMEQVRGRVATEVPSYHQHGWVTDLDAHRRERLWSNAMEALAAVAGIEGIAGFEHLAPDREPGLDSHLEWIREWYHWVVGGRERPITDAALEVVLADRPATTRVGLVWGDARIGNMMFADDLSVAAVIDWEMATLGPPELDLGWWLFFEWFLTAGFGLRRLDGIPGREETIAHHQSLTGRRVGDVEYFELLAALRMAIVIMRGADLAVVAGTLDDPTGFATGNPVTRFLAERLGLPVPAVSADFRDRIEHRTATAGVARDDGGHARSAPGRRR